MASYLSRCSLNLLKEQPRMAQKKSKKLNPKQVLAAEMLGQGYRQKEVAERLNLRGETISRWTTLEPFREATDAASRCLLDEISRHDYFCTAPGHFLLVSGVVLACATIRPVPCTLSSELTICYLLKLCSTA